MHISVDRQRFPSGFRHAPVMVLILLLFPLLLLGSAVEAQSAPSSVPPAAQNPSPMVESTRLHARLAPRELGGHRRTFPGPGGRPVEVWVSPRTKSRETYPLVIHFHGASWLADQAVASLGDGTVSAVLNLGAGSGIYDRSFVDVTVFDSLLAGIDREVSQVLGRPMHAARITLSGFSAGHGAIRRILREPRHLARVHAVLLLDGMHTSYVPEGQALAVGGGFDSTNLTAFAEFARLAMRGDKRFLVTHTEIFPGTFASTTETADWLLQTLGLQRKAVLRWGPRGVQQLSEVRAGRFVVRGFAGNSAPDHTDQYHGMPEYLRALLE